YLHRLLMPAGFRQDVGPQRTIVLEDLQLRKVIDGTEDVTLFRLIDSFADHDLTVLQRRHPHGSSDLLSRWKTQLERTKEISRWKRRWVCRDLRRQVAQGVYQ